MHFISEFFFLIRGLFLSLPEFFAILEKRPLSCLSIFIADVFFLYFQIINFVKFLFPTKVQFHSISNFIKASFPLFRILTLNLVTLYLNLRNQVFATNSNFLIRNAFQSDVANIWSLDRRELFAPKFRVHNYNNIIFLFLFTVFFLFSLIIWVIYNIHSEFFYEY